MSKTNPGGQHHITLFGLPGSNKTARPPKAPATKIVKDLLLDGEQYQELRRIADQENRSVPALIRLATREYLQRQAVEKVEPRATPAMLAAAYASDMREAFPGYYEDEMVTFSPGRDEVGYTEFQLAND